MKKNADANGILPTLRDAAGETDEVRKLRQAHGSSLPLARELFPDWTEEDLLFTIADAHGDVNLAILRITEGAPPNPVRLVATPSGTKGNWTEAACMHRSSSTMDQFGQAKEG